jgi:UDP-glucuronate 4-epimerase
MQRDFTYIDDIVEGVVRVMDKTATPNPDWNGANPDPGTSSAPYRLFNIGNNNPVMLNDFIDAIEKALGRTAERELLPMQPGDVAATYADIDDLAAAVGYRPQTPVQVGIDNFVAWYMEHMHKEKP